MPKKNGNGSLKNPRNLFTKVKTAKGRKASSTRWLQRQLNDPFIAKAQAEGYRSRAAYKLTWIDDKYGFLKHGATVIDLGAAPGSWTQIAIERTKGKVIGIDLQEIDPIGGAVFIHGDFLSEEAFAILNEKIHTKADVVMSDMAAPSCGHRQTDHIRIMDLCSSAFEFSLDVLKPGGTFLAKVLQGGTENNLLLEMKKKFTSVKHIKPDASRPDSAEMYVIALGFIGNENTMI